MFLGGLFKGMSTSTMGFLTGAAQEARRQLNPEPEEMTEREKLALKFRYDTLDKEWTKLTEVKDGMVGFGKVRNLELLGPSGEILPYQKWQWEVSTVPGETLQEQVAKWKSYTQINDLAFAEFSEEEKRKLKLYSLAHGKQMRKFLNETDEGLEKPRRLQPQWEEIIPGAPDWLINTLNANRAATDVDYNEDMIKTIPSVVLERVNKAEIISKSANELGFGGLNTAAQIEEAQGEVDLRNTEAVLNYNALTYHTFRNGGIEKGEEKNVALLHIQNKKEFPEFFTAFSSLAKHYLTSTQHPEGQSFQKMPVLGSSQQRRAYLEVVPIIYNAAIQHSQGRDPIEVYHQNAMNLYIDLFREEDIINSVVTGGDKQYIIEGKLQKEEAIKELEIDMAANNKKAEAWTQYKGVHKLFMIEMNGETAIGGKGYENIALFIDMTHSIPISINNILDKMALAIPKDSKLVPGFVKKRLQKIWNKSQGLVSKNLSSSEREWLKLHDYDGDVTALNGTSVQTAAERGQDETTSRNHNLLASIARQRALALEMTYLAAAVVQGEGGKAISDGDQKQFLRALSYGWWSTVDQRIAAAQGIYESLALYGEIAVSFSNATTAREMFGTQEYKDSSDISDYNNQSGNLIPERADPAIVDEEGDSAPKLIKILGLDAKEPNVSGNIIKENLETNRARLIQMEKAGELSDEAIIQLQVLDPDIFKIKDDSEDG